MEFDYRVAQDLPTAWLNFDLSIPLTPQTPITPGQPSRNNPFYVQRPDRKIDELRVELQNDFAIDPPKYLLSGHKGCGKSTELLRLAADPRIQQKFWVVHFSVYKLADINDLDFQDVLLLIGQQLFEQYRAQKGKLDDDFLEKLNAWLGEMTQEIITIPKGRLSGELTGKISAVMAELTSKVKIEPKTRVEIRQRIDRDITGLTNIINQIIQAVLQKEKRYPLILIDDLDKPDLVISRKLFANKQALFLPQCPIIYTVSTSLFYTPAIALPNATRKFLPNVKIHEKENRAARCSDGFYVLQTAIDRRMNSDLITAEAKELLATMSGGVFRELSRLVRASITRAQLDERSQVEVADVKGAAAEIRGELLRPLNTTYRRILQQVWETNQLEDPEEAAELLQMLAILEYDNGQTWYDVHPALWKLFDQNAPG
jgi:hypothetical protein